ncbi:MAG: Wzz/FepE/Etk N-terminal domain-containing protein [Patescibacteria group bacterium]|nr:Wzz/FepE/Etk N-terminal domain-containing protein [Patescibacteria group bacterium]
MELKDFIKLLSKKRQTVWAWIFVFIALGLIITFVQPLKYSAKSKLLVIQNTRDVDPYTVSKSNEYLGNLFSQVLYSSSFYDLTLNSQYNVNRSYFTNDATRQQKIWKKTVKAKSLNNTGIIEMEINHPDPYQAKQLALAVNDVLMNKNFNYQGMGDTVRVNVIDQPLVSNYPTNPNPLINFALSIVLGVSFGFVYIYFLPEEKYNFYLFGKSKSRRKKAQKEILVQAKTAKSEKVPVHLDGQNMETDFLAGNFVEQPQSSTPVELKGNMANILPRE